MRNANLNWAHLAVGMAKCWYVRSREGRELVMDVLKGCEVNLKATNKSGLLPNYEPT
jgi:hypothetical protein